MANEGKSSQSRNISLEQVHKMKRDIVILELQVQVRRLTKQIAQVKEVTRESTLF